MAERVDPMALPHPDAPEERPSEEVAATGTTGRILTLVPRRAAASVIPVASPAEARLYAGRRRRSLAFIFPLSLMAVDAALIGLAFFIAYHLRLLIEYPPPQNIPEFHAYLPLLALKGGVLVVVYFFYKLYRRKRVQSHLDELGRILAATSVGAVLFLAVVAFATRNEADYPSRLMLIYDWALTVGLVSLGRIAHARTQWGLQARGVAREHVLLVSFGETAEIILNAIQRSPGLGYRIIGLVCPEGHDGRAAVGGQPFLGRVDDLPVLIDRYGIDEVIIGLPEANHREILYIISRCEREKVSIKVFPDLFQFMAGEISIGDLAGLPLLTVRDIALRGWKLAVKRGVDIAISAAALVLFSPLMLLVAIAIKLESPGPVFFTQERMGLDAKPFRMIKFRSMRQDAEQQSKWTTANDPRRTRLGAMIRRFSIDELPQFINVLLGEMSIVGPRPEQPVYVEQFRRFIPRYMDRHREKAGITGWAQVNGLRGDTSVAERTKYDVWYIENWSLSLDFKIMLKTIVRVFADRNAY